MIMKVWDVAVDEYGYSSVFATSRGKALADTWRNDVFSHLTFGEFMKISNCWRCTNPSKLFGDEITVEGKQAFFIENNRAYVRFVYADSDHVMNAHPFDVLPVEYRPSTYR